MKLHSPAFESALQKGVKQAVQDDLELRQASRRSHKRPRHRWWSDSVLRPLLSILLAGLVYRTVEVTHRVDAGLMVFDLWIITLTFRFTQNLLELPFASSDIATLRLLPVSDSTIFRWEWDKFFEASLFCLSDVTAGFIVLGVLFHLSPIQWIITLGLVPVTWAFMLALAALGAGRFPRFPYGSILGPLYLLWFLLFAGAQYTFPLLMTFVDNTAPIFNVLAPTGWPLCLFQLLLPDGRWLTGLLLVPMGLILWTFKDSFQLLRTRFISFIYYEPIFEETADLMPGEDSTATTSTDGSPEPIRRPIGTTTIEEGILSGQFLRQEVWNGGWLEGKLWHWFDKREKALAEFAFPDGVAVTQLWKGIVRNFLIVTFLGFGAGIVSRDIEFAFFAIGFIVILCQAMVPMLSTGTAFRMIVNGGLDIPLYAAYPIRFRDLSRVLLKYSAIQMPLFTLLVVTSFLLLTCVFGLTLAISMLIGINAGIVFWGARLFLLVFGFSSGSNDSSTISLRSLTLFAFFALFGLVFLILVVFTAVLSIMGSVSGMIWDLQPILWVGSFLALLDGYAFFKIYGWFYHTGRFDLMRQHR
jgi:hypothetical protein